MVLVDSSIWIEAARRDGALEVKVALEALLEVAEATWCSPVKLEVFGGARREERRAMALTFAVIPFVTVREEDWDASIQLAWKLRDAGLTIPWNDVLIAAVVRRLGCRVYAKDKHFTEMANIIGLPLYTPSYGGSYDPGEE
jgi:predicted nucleic acid-binding protein